MINIWQRWKWFPPDLIWNALPVPLNLTELVTYSLAASDTLKVEERSRALICAAQRATSGISVRLTQSRARYKGFLQWL